MPRIILIKEIYFALPNYTRNINLERIFQMNKMTFMME